MVCPPGAQIYAALTYVVPVPPFPARHCGWLIRLCVLNRMLHPLFGANAPAQRIATSPCHSLLVFAGTGVDGGVIFSAALRITDIGRDPLHWQRQRQGPVILPVTFRYTITYKTFPYPPPPRGPIPLSPSHHLPIATTTTTHVQFLPSLRVLRPLLPTLAHYFSRSLSNT